MTPRQADRTIQRLLEIDTYRMMALLALPVARRLGPDLAAWDHELASITTSLATGGAQDALALLECLTTLEARIDNREGDDHFRFGASVAYYVVPSGLPPAAVPLPRFARRMGGSACRLIRERGE